MASQESPISVADNQDDLSLHLYYLLCAEFYWRVEDNTPTNTLDSGFYERLRARLLATATAHIESLSEGASDIHIPSLFDTACPSDDAIWVEVYGPQPDQPSAQQTTQTSTPPPEPLPQPSQSTFVVSSIILTSTESEGRAEEIYDGMLGSFPSDAARQAAIDQREHSLRFSANIRSAMQRPGDVVDTRSMVQTLFPADDPVWALQDAPATDQDSTTPVVQHHDDRVDSAAPTVISDSASDSQISVQRSSLSQSHSSSETSYLTSSCTHSNYSNDSDEYTAHIQDNYTPHSHSRHAPYGPAGSRRDRDDPAGARLSRTYTGERVYCECDDNQLSAREYAKPTRLRRDRRRYAQKLDQHVQYFLARLYTGMVTRHDVEELQRRWRTWLVRQDWEARNPLSQRAARRAYGNYERNGLSDENVMMGIRALMREAQVHRAYDERVRRLVRDALREMEVLAPRV